MKRTWTTRPFTTCNGDGTFQSATVLDSGGTSGNQNLPSGLVVADFNGDGIPDIAVANQAGMSDGDGSVAVLLGSGGGAFLPTVVYDSGGVTATALVAADTTGDGYLDLLIANNCTQSSCSHNGGALRYC